MEPLPAAPRSTAPVFCTKGRSENGASCAPAPTAIDTRAATRTRMVVTSTSPLIVIGNGRAVECGCPGPSTTGGPAGTVFGGQGPIYKDDRSDCREGSHGHDTCTDTRDDDPGLDIRGTRHALGHAAYRTPSPPTAPRATFHPPPCSCREPQGFGTPGRLRGFFSIKP